MARIASFELLAVDLPFRKPFKHSAAERSSSSSLFLRCATDSGTEGYGECLPREYVSGESRDGALAMLRDEILPHLVGWSFGSLKEVETFLRECDGKTPGWVEAARPQTAAWSAVDLGLLDTFGREFGRTVLASRETAFPPGLRYSGVLSADRGFKLIKSCAKMRLFGLRSIKMKVERDTPDEAFRTASRILGMGVLRVDANMAWSADEAGEAMRKIAKHGIRSFEQPIDAADLDGLSRLVEETGFDVMADESLTDGESMRRLLERKACTAINARISKCGGMIAARTRCEEALAAGLKVQIGCQVGESSLLSSAHLALTAAVGEVAFAEGCFGHYLLREDPASPVLQFGYGGRPPRRPGGPGLGVVIDRSLLGRFASATATIP